MNHVHVKGLILVSAIFVLSALLGLTGSGVFSDRPVNIVELNTEITEESSDNLKKAIDAIKERSSGRILVQINSPGGGVFDGKLGAAEIANNPNIDTYVAGIAASMGAQTFMAGHRRFMEKDAVILFHGANIGSEIGTQKGIEKLLRILDSDEFKDSIEHAVDNLSKEAVKPTNLLEALLSNRTKVAPMAVGDPLDHAYANMLREDVMQRGFYSVYMDLTNTLSILKVINNSALSVFDDVIKKSEGRWTRERVQKEIYGDFEKDMIFTGEQMLQMGLVDGLGMPPKENYR